VSSKNNRKYHDDNIIIIKRVTAWRPDFVLSLSISLSDNDNSFESTVYIIISALLLLLLLLKKKTFGVIPGMINKLKFIQKFCSLYRAFI
jgi:hypothetical protein